MQPRGRGVVGLEVIDWRGSWLRPAASAELLPGVVGRHQVAIPQFGRLARSAGDGERTSVIGRRPAGRRGRCSPIGPRRRPARLHKFRRHVPAVVHALQHRHERRRRLAGDHRCGIVPTGPDVAPGDKQRLSRQSHEPLDVVGLGVFGILEDHYVPPSRFGEVVGELVDEDPVTVERWIPRIGLARPHGQRHFVAAVEAPRFRHEPIGTDAAGGLVPLLTGPDPKLGAARGAGEILVATHERGRHRPGWNHEGLRLEGPEEEGEREGDDDRFDRLPAGGQRIADDIAPPAGRRAARSSRSGG